MAQQEGFKSPEGWVNTTLNDICQKIQDGNYGGSYPKKDEWVEDGIPFITGAALGDNCILEHKLRFVDEEKHSTLTKAQVTSNDVIFPNRGATDSQLNGKSNLAYLLGKRFSNANINPQITLLRSTDAVVPSFLKNYVCSPYFLDRLKEVTKGSALTFINLTKTKEIEIPLAPLAEQKRIVEKLDSLLAQVDTIQQRLNNLPDIIKRFRQSVLAAAVSGKLTEQWRGENEFTFGDKSIEHITKLVDSFYENKAQKAVMNGKRKPKHPRANKKAEEREEVLPVIPSEWKYQRLEDITYLVSDGTHKTPKYKNEGVPFFSVKNVRPFKVSDENIKFVSQDEYEEIDARCNSEENDILYTKVGATFGFAARNTITYNHAIYVSLALIKPVFDFFNSKYAELVMNSPVVLEQARKRVSGSGVPDLHLIEIRDFKIPVPHIEEQTEIVRLVEQYFALADTLEKNLANAKQRVDNLTQSILAKAFKGELVPQDPSDEPADKLLERIKAARIEAEKLEKAAKKAAKASKAKQNK